MRQLVRRIEKLERVLPARVAGYSISELTDEELDAAIAGDISPALAAKLAYLDLARSRIVGLHEEEVEALLKDGLE